jgi:glucosamine kinase
MVPSSASQKTSAAPARERVAFFIGVDGGASGTRICIAGRDGRLVAQGRGGPSALGLGRDEAWHTILNTVSAAFSQAGVKTPAWSECAMGLGMSGVHNKAWAGEFSAKSPEFASVQIDTDAFTTLLGAHRGRPGAIIALGTGSVGEVLHEDGTRQEVGGWGFPSGDEAGGCGMGLRAIRQAQHAIDNHEEASAFTDAVLDKCGGRTRDALFAWLIRANQTTYAELAPLVIAHCQSDTHAARIVRESGEEIARTARALDPQNRYPLALCGGLAEPLWPFVPEPLRQRLQKPVADSTRGALQLIAHHLDFPLHEDIWANSNR